MTMTSSQQAFQILESMIKGRREAPIKDCFLRCLGGLLQWIEDVNIDESQPGTLKIEVLHSYPEGIDIGPWVVSTLEAHLAVGVGYTISYRIVAPGSGALRAARCKPAR